MEAVEANLKRLQDFQMSQTKEMTELRSLLHNNTLQLGKQMFDLAASVQGCSSSTKTSHDLEERTIKTNQKVIELEPDPDKPSYAASIYSNPDYIPLKHIKFDMPKFDGTNPELWIFMARRFFIFHNTPEDQKLIIASFSMQDVALKWFLWMESSNYLSTWPAFVQSLLKKFNPTTYTMPGGKLSKLVQTSSVSDYVAKYEDYSAKVVRIFDWFLLEMFVSGLKEDIQKEVVRAKLDDIQEAMELAVHLEHQGITSPQPKTVGFKNFSNRSYTFKPVGDTLQQLTTNNNFGVQKSTSTTPIFKRLSFAERKEMTAKCLCFNCEEKFIPGHKYVQRQTI